MVVVVVNAMQDDSHGGTVSASIMTGSGALRRSRCVESQAPAEKKKKSLRLIADNPRDELGQTGRRWSRPVVRCNTKCWQCCNNVEMEQMMESVREGFFFFLGWIHMKSGGCWDTDIKAKRRAGN